MTNNSRKSHLVLGIVQQLVQQLGLVQQFIAIWLLIEELIYILKINTRPHSCTQVSQPRVLHTWYMSSWPFNLDTLWSLILSLMYELRSMERALRSFITVMRSDKERDDSQSLLFTKLQYKKKQTNIITYYYHNSIH